MECIFIPTTAPYKSPPDIPTRVRRVFDNGEPLGLYPQNYRYIKSLYNIHIFPHKPLSIYIIVIVFH